MHHHAAPTFFARPKPTPEKIRSDGSTIPPSSFVTLIHSFILIVAPAAFSSTGTYRYIF
jgi:hypothetical protein